MNERIKELRKYLDLTLEEFGARIGMTKSNVSLIEHGRNTPREQTIALICQVYGVNETWLRTGEGEMFSRRPSRVDSLLREFPMSELCAKMLYAFDALPPHQQEAVLEYFNRLLQSMAQDDPAAVAESIAPPEEKGLRQALADRLTQETSSPSPASENGTV